MAKNFVNPLFAPDDLNFNWLEEHHQEHIATWLRDQKRVGRLSFDVGMEGVRITSNSLRGRLKRQGMDSGVPDLKLKLKGGVLLHIELKRWKGSVSADQKTEHELLKSLGHNIEIVKEKTPQRALERVKELVAEYENA